MHHVRVAIVLTCLVAFAGCGSPPRLEAPSTPESVPTGYVVQAAPYLHEDGTVDDLAEALPKSWVQAEIPPMALHAYGLMLDRSLHRLVRVELKGTILPNWIDTGPFYPFTRRHEVRRMDFEAIVHPLVPAADGKASVTFKNDAVPIEDVPVAYRQLAADLVTRTDAEFPASKESARAAIQSFLDKGLRDAQKARDGGDLAGAQARAGVHLNLAKAGRFTEAASALERLRVDAGRELSEVMAILRGKSLEFASSAAPTTTVRFGSDSPTPSALIWGAVGAGRPVQFRVQSCFARKTDDGVALRVRAENSSRTSKGSLVTEVVLIGTVDPATGAFAGEQSGRIYRVPPTRPEKRMPKEAVRGTLK